MSDNTEEHTTHSTSPDGSTETETTEKTTGSSSTTDEQRERVENLGDGSPSGHAEDDGDSDTVSGGEPEDN